MNNVFNLEFSLTQAIEMETHTNKIGWSRELLLPVILHIAYSTK